MLLELAYSTCRPYWSCTELGKERLLVVVRNRADDIDKPGDTSKAKLFGHLGAELIERDGFVGVMRFDQLCSDR